MGVVILSGSAGTGKARLALHYAKNHPDIKNEKVYCIHSNALPIYEDLKLYIDRPGNYFLFIDDAALQKVINDVRDITSYEIVNINAFSDGMYF